MRSALRQFARTLQVNVVRILRSVSQLHFSLFCRYCDRRTYGEGNIITIHVTLLLSLVSGALRSLLSLLSRAVREPCTGVCTSSEKIKAGRETGALARLQNPFAEFPSSNIARRKANATEFRAPRGVPSITGTLSGAGHR